MFKRRNKREDHVNCERWLVCYADMVTLLFAMFVVLYAMGVQDLDKLTDVARSVKWAFHIEGTGGSYEEGPFDSGSGHGMVPEAAPLETGQDGPMEEFLDEQLADEFQRITGASLQYDQLDGCYRITTPLSAWYVGLDADGFRNRGQVFAFLSRLVQGAMQRTVEMRVRIEAHDIPIPGSDGTRRSSLDLCGERLAVFMRMVQSVNGVAPARVWGELRTCTGRFRGSWQDAGRLILEFDDGRPRESRDRTEGDGAGADRARDTGTGGR